ncbi:carbohydrate ABC transporter permease [Actinokineospora soli]|uniref:Carbohydrate ABC transporter permease n=1 Tax=Actinokineospora soli TaxID=1048753 RepID=A0ABW2TMS7_9PSEU
MFSTYQDAERRARGSARPPSGPVPARSRLSGRAREALAFYGFISPWLVGFVVFVGVPMVASLWLSFTDWDSFQAPEFIGLDNYTRLLTEDPLFWRALLHTLYFAAVSVPLSLLIALGLASLLSKPMAGARIFRTAIYIPALVPLVAAAMIFKWLLAPEAGPLNGLLGLLGVDGPAWLLDENWVIPAVILLSLWQVGAGTILLIAALQGVPPELYEAATLDGASRTQQFWRISVPIVTPVLFFNLITGMIAGFQVFSQVYVLTEGTSGPDNASLMLVPYVYDTAFRNYEMGYASALAWVLFLIVMVFTAGIMRSSKSWVFYESEIRS